MSREPVRQPLRRAPPKLPPRSPEGEVLHAALQRLTAHPDWQTFVDHMKAREIENAFSGVTKEPGALLRDEGRRSLIVELERLKDRLNDDDPTQQQR